jgi:hypothetical protein
VFRQQSLYFIKFQLRQGRFGKNFHTCTRPPADPCFLRAAKVRQYGVIPIW